MVMTKQLRNVRHLPRIPLQGSVTCLTPEILAKGLLVDASREGLRIESNVPVHIGMRLALVLFLPQDQEPLMIEEATVKWVCGKHFGVQFVKWSTSAEARLGNFFWAGIESACEWLCHLLAKPAEPRSAG
jgi:PilZ domain